MSVQAFKKRAALPLLSLGGNLGVRDPIHICERRPLDPQGVDLAAALLGERKSTMNGARTHEPAC